ncbi:hypothetical protein IT568_11210, partial [bacterium]|nr:hypothetical protein [bacterium]
MKKLAIFWLVLFFSQTLKATSLSFSTFLGGGSFEYFRGIEINPVTHEIVLSGFTDSFDFPTTSGTFDNSFNGGNRDVLVTKFDSTATNLIFSTFLGGAEEERSYTLDLDENGFAYVGGYSFSSNFPTANAYDATHNG